MNTSDLTAIIIAIISSGIGIELVKWLIDYFDRKNGFSRTLEVISKIQSCLNSFMEETEGSRANFVIVTNGGEIPALNTNWYMTILLDATNPPLKSEKDKYKYFEIDPEYKQIIADLKSRNKIRIYTSDLNGILRSAKEPSSITHSDMILLEVGKHWLTYVTIDYVDENDNDMSQDQEMYVITNKLKNIKISKVIKNFKVNGIKLS